VDWTSQRRSALESAAEKGTVVVRYADCKLEILPRCTANGHYQYQRVNRKDDQIEIKDDAQLYATVPLGAATLATRLHKAGQLYVNATAVGQYENSSKGVPRSTLRGDCSTATHYVAVRTVGAFVFSTEAEGAKGVGIEVGRAEAKGAESGASTEISRDGIKRACHRSAVNDANPPENCGASIGLTLARFDGDNDARENKQTPVAPSPIASNKDTHEDTRATSSPSSSSSSQRTWGWISLGVGAAGAAAFATTGILAMSKRSSLDGSEGCDSATHQCMGSRADVDSYNLMKNLSTGTLPVGIVGIGTGLTLLLTAPSSPAEERAGVRPWFGVGSAGLEGRF